jgi:hypothetical protein
MPSTTVIDAFWYGCARETFDTLAHRIDMLSQRIGAFGLPIDALGQ